MKISNVKKPKVIDAVNSVIYSKIKINRNIDNYNFPHLLSEENKENLENLIIDYIKKKDYALKIYDLSQINDNEKKILIDNDLLDIDNADKNRGKFIIFKNYNISLTFNDEDHLNFLIINPFLSLNEAYNKIDHVVEDIGNYFSYTASLKYGFLTSKIKNCGMAMKIYVLMNLAGLIFTSSFEDTSKLYAERGFTFEPWHYNSGSKDNKDEKKSSCFLISSNINFGVTEEILIQRFIIGIKKLFEKNQKLLLKYYDDNKSKLVDTIFRSYGILKFTKQISYHEAFDHLANIRIGLELNEKIDISFEALNKLFFNIKNGYVGKIAKQKNISDNAARALIIRSHLNKNKRNANV